MKPYQHVERTKKHENKGKKPAFPRGGAWLLLPISAPQKLFHFFFEAI